jgi:hypothetical protein
MVCYAPLRIKSQSFLKIIRLDCPPWSHDCIVLVKPSESETGEPPRSAAPPRPAAPPASSSPSSRTSRSFLPPSLLHHHSQCLLLFTLQSVYYLFALPCAAILQVLITSLVLCASSVGGFEPDSRC